MLGVIFFIINVSGYSCCVLKKNQQTIYWFCIKDKLYFLHLSGDSYV